MGWSDQAELAVEDKAPPAVGKRVRRVRLFSFVRDKSNRRSSCSPSSSVSSPAASADSLLDDSSPEVIAWLIVIAGLWGFGRFACSSSPDSGEDDFRFGFICRRHQAADRFGSRGGACVFWFGFGFFADFLRFIFVIALANHFGLNDFIFLDIGNRLFRSVNRNMGTFDIVEQCRCRKSRDQNRYAPVKKIGSGEGQEKLVRRRCLCQREPCSGNARNAVGLPACSIRIQSNNRGLRLRCHRI